MAAINNTTSYPLTTSLVNSDQVIVLTNSGTYLKKITKANLESSLSINDTLLAGKIVYVDSVNGSDSTGTRGNVGLPFLTLAAAQTAASSGDLIDVYPGSYTITATLGKNGVNWNLRPGVTLTNASGGAVFNDGGSALTYTVCGMGALSNSGAVPSGTVGLINVTNASSNIVIECKSLASTATGENPEQGSPTLAAVVYQTGGTLHIKTDTITWNGGGLNQGWALYWINGELDIEFTSLVCAGGYAIGAAVTATPTGDMYVRGSRITATGFDAIANTSSQAQAKLWLNVDLIEVTSFGAIFTSGGKTYVNSQKIAGCTGSGDNANGVIYGTAGSLWLTAQKITGTYGYGFHVAGSTVEATVQQIEDLGHLTSGTLVSSGTLELDRAQCVVALGNGVTHSGGTQRLMGCRFDTSASASKNPATVSGSGLILDRCTLIPNASADSVTAGSAKTITAYKTVAKTAKNVNVTVNVDALTVDSNVV